jgi:hypothetical protein
MTQNQVLSRREFIGLSAVALALARTGQAAEGAVPRLGACGNLKSAEIIKAGGAAYLEESVGNFLKPDQKESEFQDQLKKAQAAGVALYSCNGSSRLAQGGGAGGGA